ncbi:Alpha-1,3-mannosyl-glycoprotein 4-beta-N-acetylglucosaminyltransferase C [Manis javanica]|nr:Alpha-1,3-mannosyl-glycoprotein 4-beta-N-acetylglucosaminyltransferase C [Manis javanica]
MTQEEPDPIPDAMRCSIRRCIIASVSIGFLWLFTILEVPREIEDDRNAMAIKGQVNTMRPNPWVLLELSDVGSLGRLPHSRDLPALAHFLIFPKEKPLDRLTPCFRVLLAQRNPGLCSPFFFYRRLS